MIVTLLLLLASFLLGTILGSFAKVVADRSLTRRSFLWGRSHCPSCHHPLKFFDLIPIVSFVLLSGKCRYCQKPISLEYLIIELVMGGLVGGLVFQVAEQLINLENFYQISVFLLNLVFKIFLVTVLVIVSVTDLKKNLIPDKVIIPALWISLIYLSFLTISKISYLYYYLNQTEVGQLLLPPHTDYFQRHASLHLENLVLAVGSGLVIGLFFLIVVMITKGRGMGGGDVKLGGFLGLALGFPQGLIAVMLAFFAGALIGLGLILAQKKRFGQTIPFGPFLSLGGLMVIFWGQSILDWFFRLKWI